MYDPSVRFKKPVKAADHTARTVCLPLQRSRVTWALTDNPIFLPACLLDCLSAENHGYNLTVRDIRGWLTRLLCVEAVFCKPFELYTSDSTAQKTFRQEGSPEEGLGLQWVKYSREGPTTESDVEHSWVKLSLRTWQQSEGKKLCKRSLSILRMSSATSWAMKLKRPVVRQESKDSSTVCWMPSENLNQQGVLSRWRTQEKAQPEVLRTGLVHTRQDQPVKLVLFQGIYSKHDKVGRESSCGFYVGHRKQRLPMVWVCGEDEMGGHVRCYRAGDRGNRYSLGTLQAVELLCSKLGYTPKQQVSLNHWVPRFAFKKKHFPVLLRCIILSVTNIYF